MLFNQVDKSESLARKFITPNFIIRFWFQEEEMHRLILSVCSKRMNMHASTHSNYVLQDCSCVICVIDSLFISGFKDAL